MSWDYFFLYDSVTHMRSPKRSWFCQGQVQVYLMFFIASNFCNLIQPSKLCIDVWSKRFSKLANLILTFFFYDFVSFVYQSLNLGAKIPTQCNYFGHCWVSFLYHYQDSHEIRDMIIFIFYGGGVVFGT